MGKSSLYKFIIFWILVGLTACTASPADIPVVANPDDATSQPVMRILDLDALITPSPTVVIPTPVPTPTRKPSPTPPPTGAQVPSSPTPACTNRMEFLSHLTISPNTMLRPGEIFAKLWRVMNAGTCTWTPAYSLVFTGGHPLDGPAEVPLLQEVKPGETFDLRLDLVAPPAATTYESYWMLRDDAGNLFGSGETAEQALSIVIRVEIPPPTKPT